MHKILLLLALTWCTLSVSAQNTMNTKKDIDPKARQILDKLKKQYDSYKSMEVKFELTMELPGQPAELQKGNVIQDGKKYMVKMNDQEIYSDGKTVWVYLKKNKEVQINNAEEGAGSEFLSPKQMLRLYETENFVYAITEERTENGKQVADIEFKPLEKKSEYSKMRLTVDKSANKMLSLRIFSKDGSRYTLKVNDLIPNKTYEAGIFAFNPKAYPGVHIEDLRID